MLTLLFQMYFPVDTIFRDRVRVHFSAGAIFNFRAASSSFYVNRLPVNLLYYPSIWQQMVDFPSTKER